MNITIHDSPEERESFIDYWNRCEKELMTRYGITPGDAYTADDVAGAQDEDWTPEEFARRIGNKYDLDPIY